MPGSGTEREARGRPDMELLVGPLEAASRRSTAEDAVATADAIELVDLAEATSGSEER